MLKSSAVLLLLSAPVFTLSAAAQATPQPLKAQPAVPVQAAASPIVATGHALEAADLEAFFDGIVPMQLERSDIAGATVLVMQDGKILLKKGYGYDDLKTKTPVDPDTSVFRLASISKLSTWISILQLEEQGKVDLDTDINRYLDFTIRPAPHSVSDKPITLRNLMTHTGGFEEESKLVVNTDPRYKISLRDFLIQNQPRRIFPPGEVPAYSNYGVGLASYIVQRVSGEPFESYTQHHIYAPLKMYHSTFEQPLPKTLHGSLGYLTSTTSPAQSFEFFNPVGAGAFSSTAADMGRFGQALLNGGELDGARILKAETLARMWTPQYRSSPEMPAMCMGFYQRWRNNLRWIGHQGDLTAFHSMFWLEPAQKLVLFASYNSVGSRNKPRAELINMFSDRYFPAHAEQKFVSLPRDELKAIEGTYESTRRADSTRLKLGLITAQGDVTVNKDGEMTMEDGKDLRGHTVHFKPIGKDLWQAIGEQARVFAIRDGSGKVVRLAFDFPGQQDQRVPWFENRAMVMPLLILSLLAMVLVAGASLARTGHRVLLHKRPRPEPQPGTVWLPHVTQVTAWLWVLVVTAIAIAAISMGDDAMPPTPAWEPYVWALNVGVGLILLLSIFAVLSGLGVWRRELRTITKVKFSLVALACLFLDWFAIHWHLLGPVSRI
jgi:CubicO group peptidase (beta-lactamase class C family)